MHARPHGSGSGRPGGEDALAVVPAAVRARRPERPPRTPSTRA